MEYVAFYIYWAKLPLPVAPILKGLSMPWYQARFEQAITTSLEHGTNQVSAQYSSRQVLDNKVTR